MPHILSISPDEPHGWPGASKHIWNLHYPLVWRLWESNPLQTIMNLHSDSAAPASRLPVTDCLPYTREVVKHLTSIAITEYDVAHGGVEPPNDQRSKYDVKNLLRIRFRTICTVCRAKVVNQMQQCTPPCTNANKGWRGIVDRGGIEPPYIQSASTSIKRFL